MVKEKKKEVQRELNEQEILNLNNDEADEFVQWGVRTGRFEQFTLLISDWVGPEGKRLVNRYKEFGWIVYKIIQYSDAQHITLLRAALKK